MTSRLDAIKARAEAATDGPWVQGRFIDSHHTSRKSDEWKSNADEQERLSVRVGDPMGEHVARITDGDHSDAVFIAHARQDIPALLAAVEAVLELHKPITDDGNSLRNWLGVYDGKPRDYCNECEVDGYTAVPYPCPTVTAIQSALGEVEK